MSEVNARRVRELHPKIESLAPAEYTSADAATKLQIIEQRCGLILGDYKTQFGIDDTTTTTR